VLGASFDTPEENKTFADTEQFGFRLLSDVDRSVGKLYGAARPDDHDFAALPRRVSFLIDPDGVVRRTYNVKDVATHADDVLADLASLRGAQP
jgi:peroxiredoxin Q/BCP